MCPDHHGFWLDEGEDKQVLDYMRERRRALGRIAAAERSWHTARLGGRDSFFDKIKRFLGMS